MPETNRVALAGLDEDVQPLIEDVLAREGYALSIVPSVDEVARMKVTAEVNWLLDEVVRITVAEYIRSTREDR